MERYGVIQQGIDPAAMRAYKILRTQLLRKLDAEGWKSLAVTAIGVGDGKTVTALNLAISLARDVNTRVTLVDLDLQRPAVATYLGLRAELGLDSYLAGNATLEQITYDIGIERLAVIPTLGPVPQSSEMLTSPAMMALLEDLRALGQIVIFDLPPMLLGDDVLALAPHADAVLLVVGEGTTSRSALEGARTVLEDMRIAGVVLNRSSERDEHDLLLTWPRPALAGKSCLPAGSHPASACSALQSAPAIARPRSERSLHALPRERAATSASAMFTRW